MSDYEYIYSPSLPPLDGMLVHSRVTPSSNFAGTHLYTWVKRSTVRVKCLAQEHNAVPRPRIDPGPLDPESSALTIRPQYFPLFKDRTYRLYTYPWRSIWRKWTLDLREQTLGSLREKCRYPLTRCTGDSHEPCRSGFFHQPLFYSDQGLMLS